MKKTLIILSLTLSFFAVLPGCRNNDQAQEPLGPPTHSTLIIGHYVTNNFPHDRNLFTEGFLFHNGQLLESTGSPLELTNTRSVVGIQDLKTGKLEIKAELDKTKYFGEGIAVLKDKLYQLTYKNQVGFIYDVNTFKKIAEFKYDNAEGWGLTTDGTNLIMSDGTNKLTFLEPDHLSPVKTLSVTENDIPLDKLNELEFIKGFIYANVWTTNYIVKIDPATGKVVAKLDLDAVAVSEKNKNPNAMEMNGIAYDPVSDQVYITGKLWDNIYQIDFKR